MIHVDVLATHITFKSLSEELVARSARIAIVLTKDIHGWQGKHLVCQMFMFYSYKGIHGFSNVLCAQLSVGHV
jgi:hypothetical protein